MRVYKSTSESITCCFDELDGMLDELREFAENAVVGDKIEYSVLEMSEEEYSNLREFDGR